MGQDDENEGGGAGECPRHEFLPIEYVPVDGPFGIQGLGIWHECVTPGCDARWYEPSTFELPEHRRPPA